MSSNLSNVFSLVKSQYTSLVEVFYYSIFGAGTEFINHLCQFQDGAINVFTSPPTLKYRGDCSISPTLSH